MLERLASPFRFTATSVAAAAIVIYAALFASVLVFDGLPRVPKNTRGLDLDRAYQALSVVRPAVLLFVRLPWNLPSIRMYTLELHRRLNITRSAEVTHTVLW